MEASSTATAETTGGVAGVAATGAGTLTAAGRSTEAAGAGLCTAASACAAFFAAFREQAPAAFRVELLLEDVAETERTLRGYQRLLAGTSTGPMIIRELNLRSQLGVTTGTLGGKSES